MSGAASLHIPHSGHVLSLCDMNSLLAANVECEISACDVEAREERA